MTNLRKWLTWPLLAASLALAPVQAGPPAAPPAPRSAPPQARQMAVTIDDLPVTSVLPTEFGKQRQVTVALLAALQAHKVPAIGFVNEGKLVQNGMSGAEGKALLETWIRPGMAPRQPHLRSRRSSYHPAAEDA